MTIEELLSEARSSLSGPEASQEAELLMQDICGIGRSRLFSHPDEALTKNQIQLYRDALQRRVSGEPLAYITGHRGFWDMDLKVSADVLIPRPDTECLVEQALERIPLDVCWQIADLGTGSGAIAIAIARERPQNQITATDNSPPALAIAMENARAFGAKNIDFISGSWGQPLASAAFDMILSNPPYIRADDPHMKSGDLVAEPEAALVSGEDGLQAIRQIIVDSAHLLKAGGWLLLEHGFDQAAQVAGLLHKAGFDEVFSRQDYAGNDRVTGGKKV